MDFQTLVGRAMTDEKFAQALADDPEAALKAAGIQPTAEMLEALRGVDAAAIRRLAEAFGENRSALG